MEKSYGNKLDGNKLAKGMCLARKARDRGSVYLVVRGSSIFLLKLAPKGLTCIICDFVTYLVKTCYYRCVTGDLCDTYLLHTKEVLRIQHIPGKT